MVFLIVLLSGPTLSRRGVGDSKILNQYFFSLVGTKVGIEGYSELDVYLWGK